MSHEGPPGLPERNIELSPSGAVWFVTAFETDGGIPVTLVLFTKNAITTGALFQI